MHIDPHELIVEGPGDDGEDERLGSSREPPVFAPKRGLKERHIGVMAISGMLGTGIFLASGRALADAGPAGALLGYVVMGLVTIAVALTAAEMSALCPATGGFIAHAQKFVDPALGAAIGWNFAYALAIVQAVEITAASLLGRSLVAGLACIILF
ncbi:hypothetical protein M407DRAFT_30695 [Tulasnella calospora MUT 4182]|uniref:Amino acid permease/ SLC12A domain-containing protein n=1 Tax=Tulasnella calospora MUT 4182 TaxID=1051891 RepID=A0A0C3KDY0_9AGAM|nr:hypothetical protein M407DRAFT_30695 [Tulasnella calospora MUT 4182]